LVVHGCRVELVEAEDRAAGIWMSPAVDADAEALTDVLGSSTTSSASETIGQPSSETATP
jgi:hypothetical protein